MKGLVILANGFEDTEAIATIDVLKRAKLEIDTASISDSLEVVTQYKHKIKASLFLSDAKFEEYDFLVVPGGGAVFRVLDHEALVDEVINDFVSKGKLVAAICAAPHLIGKNGHLNDKEYTCFPGCENAIIGGKKLNDGVVVDGKIITGKSMYYSIEFGLAIIKELLGEDAALQVANAIKGK